MGELQQESIVRAFVGPDPVTILEKPKIWELPARIGAWKRDLISRSTRYAGSRPTPCCSACCSTAELAATFPTFIVTKTDRRHPQETVLCRRGP